MNLLFICSRNEWRSRTAETIFHDSPGYVVRSAGTSPSSRRQINAQDLGWADVIFVMEKKHAEILKHKYPNEIKSKILINLDIPDEYQYMDPQLVEILQSTVPSALDSIA